MTRNIATTVGWVTACALLLAGGCGKPGGGVRPRVSGYIGKVDFTEGSQVWTTP